MKCPVCNNGNLVFDPGYPATREEPGEPACLYCDICDTEQKEIEKYLVFDVFDLAKKMGCEVELIAKIIYKNTECGCEFSHNESGVTLAGYAEGFDGDCPAHTLTFPFFIKDFWETLDIADKEGSAIWTCINEHEDGCECYLYVGE